MNDKSQQIPDWGKDIEQSADSLGLRCSVNNASMAADLGFPCVGESNPESEALILWNLQQRPICVYKTSGKVIVIVAKVLQPDIQFGIGTELVEDKHESLLRLVKGIAFMVGEKRLKVNRQRDDIETMLELAAGAPLYAQTITAALKELMTVQNVFQQCLDNELPDPAIDLIAKHYALSQIP